MFRNEKMLTNLKEVYYLIRALLEVQKSELQKNFPI